MIDKEIKNLNLKSCKTKGKICFICGGSGKITGKLLHEDGFIKSDTIVCWRCNGKGWIKI